MKKLLLVFSVLVVLFSTGCSDIRRMNTNMEESIQSVEQNTKTVQRSSEVISKNTKEIAESTVTMRIYMPIVIIVIIAILIYPAFVLIKLQRKLLQDIQFLVNKLKR